MSTQQNLRHLLYTNPGRSSDLRTQWCPRENTGGDKGATRLNNTSCCSTTASKSSALQIYCKDDGSLFKNDTPLKTDKHCGRKASVCYKRRRPPCAQKSKPNGPIYLSPTVAAVLPGLAAAVLSAIILLDACWHPSKGCSPTLTESLNTRPPEPLMTGSHRLHTAACGAVL